MLGSHRWTEPVTAQHDSGSRWRGVIMGADVFSGLINISIAAALVTLLLRHVWIVPNLNALLAFAALIILTTTVLSFLSAQVAGRSTAGLRIGSSVNDNLTPKAVPGAELADALRRCRFAFLGVGLFSGLINILMLTGPLFMLQVYDRVLPSHSVPTLIGLAILTAGLFACSRASWMPFAAAFCCGLVARSMMNSPGASMTFVRLPLKMRRRRERLAADPRSRSDPQLSQQRRPGALFDLPWMPLYVGICFLFHPLIGIAAASGALVLIVLTLADRGCDANTGQGRGRLRRRTSHAARSKPAQCRSRARLGHGRSHVGPL